MGFKRLEADDFVVSAQAQTSTCWTNNAPTLTNFYTQSNQMPNVVIAGIMGMSTHTQNQEIINSEFRTLKNHFDFLKNTYFKNQAEFAEVSMGMSNDYALAIQNGSSMVRIGSLIFGERV